MATKQSHAFQIHMTLVICMLNTAHSTNPNPVEFVKSSCKGTLYPVLCVQSLLSYATVIHRSNRQLAITALSVSVSRTRSSASFVKNMSKKGRGMKPREWRAVQDCVETIGDSVENLRDSVRELGRTGRAMGEEFAWHMSNVQTWVSAALTDDNTCLDGFAESAAINGNVKNAIKERVVHVAQLTSNALAFVNRFASNHPPQTP